MGCLGDYRDVLLDAQGDFSGLYNEGDRIPPGYYVKAATDRDIEALRAGRLRIRRDGYHEYAKAEEGTG